MNEFLEFWQKLFSPEGFPARWYCGKWTDFHGWLYIFSHLAIWAAYFGIPLSLFHFATRRKDVPLRRIIYWFIAFILLCGITHLTDAIIFWLPVYRLNALFLFFTAVVSVATLVVFIRELPHISKLKSPSQLRAVIESQTKELQEAYLKLAKSEAQFKALVQNNPDLIARFDKNLKHTFVNEAVTKIFQQPASYFVGKTHEELGFDKPQAVFLVDKVKETFELKEPILTELVPVDKDESQYYQMSLAPLFNNLDDRNEVTEVITILRNITDSKLRQKELKTKVDELQAVSDRLSKRTNQLENFAGIVSHNLRSPIANLLGLINLWDDAEESEKKQYYQLFKVSVDKLSMMVEDLAAIVSVYQDIDLSFNKLAFQEVLSHILTSLTTQIKHSDAQVNTNFEAESVNYPKVYLESIFMNLLTTAIKYRSPNRPLQINITSEENEDFVILKFSDNGLGIDLNKYGNKIFGLHKTFHRNTDARGVGLFLVKSQLEHLNGEIEVSSEVDKGTTFTLYFNKRLHV